MLSEFGLGVSCQFFKLMFLNSLPKLKEFLPIRSQMNRSKIYKCQFVKAVLAEANMLWKSISIKGLKIEDWDRIISGSSALRTLKLRERDMGG